MTEDTIEQPATTVAEYSATAAGLRELQVRMKDRAYDLTTGRGMDEAKKDRRELVSLRTSLEKMRVDLNKADRATIAAKIELRDGEAARITAEIKALEEPIDQQIKAEEARKEAEKQAKAEAERLRVAAILERVQALGKHFVRAIGKTASEVEAVIGELGGVAIDDSFAEFKDQAAAVVADTLVKLNGLHEATQRAEEKAAELKAQEEALQRQREADAAAQRDAQAKLDAERAAFDAQQAEAKRLADEAIQAQAKAEAERKAAEDAERDRIEAIKSKIQEMGYTVVHLADKPSTEIRAKAESLLQMTLEGFDEFHAQAEEVRNTAAKRLESMAATAEKAEADAAELKREQADLAEQKKADADRKAAEEAAAAAKAAEEQRAKAREAMAESQRLAALRGAAAQMLEVLGMIDRRIQQNPEGRNEAHLGHDECDSVRGAIDAAQTVKPNPIE